MPKTDIPMFSPHRDISPMAPFLTWLDLKYSGNISWLLTETSAYFFPVHVFCSSHSFLSFSEHPTNAMLTKYSPGSSNSVSSCYFEGEFLDYEPFFHFYIRTYFCTCVVWIEDTECGRKSCTFGYERLFFPGAIGESRCCSSGHLCFDKSIMSQ